ncbi:MAG: DUF3352 domain-containing protein [Mariniblastus sp.]|nr:DUF3352 domain-containing protein [Mariniblastus sp.]
MSTRNCLQICVGLLIGLLPTTTFAYQLKNTKAELEFYRGYYLQHESHNAKEAIEAYRAAIKMGANEKLRSTIDQKIAGVQEELVTADFAQLMPANSIAYAEINQAGNHAENLFKLLGLTARQFSSSDEKAHLRLDSDFSIPSDFQIPSTLLCELKKIRGAAVAITAIENSPRVDGIAVIHAGDSDLITGIMETAVQFAPVESRIAGYPTFNIEDEVWIVKTERLVLVSTQKEMLNDCISKITVSSNSLADNKQFQSAKAQNQDSAIFAFVSPQAVIANYGKMFQGELGIARMVLDLDSMKHLTWSLAANDIGLRTRMAVKFEENHHSFGYGLIRTAPLSRKALSHIPSGAAGVVGMGLNPKMVLAAQAAGSQPLSALDIGREFFANIEEIGIFVLPTVSSIKQLVPDVGVVISSADIEKSNSLWNQLLTLPSKLDLEDGPRASLSAIDGVAVHEYSFPDDEIPQVLIARIGEDAMVIGTRGAVEATIAATKSGQTLANDQRAAAFWSAKSEHTSKAAFISVSHALRLAAKLEGGSSAQEMLLAAQVLDDLAVTVVVNEAPANFVIQSDVVGLPIFENVIKTFAKINVSPRHANRSIHMPNGRAGVAVKIHEPRATKTFSTSSDLTNE